MRAECHRLPKFRLSDLFRESDCAPVEDDTIGRVWQTAGGNPVTLGDWRKHKRLGFLGGNPGV